MLIILLPHHFKFPVLYTRISPQGGTSTLEDLLLIWRVTSSWGFEELLLLSSLSLFISSSWVPPSMLEDLLLAWSLPLFSSSSSWADPSKFEDLLLVWSFPELSIIHGMQITKSLLLKIWQNNLRQVVKLLPNALQMNFPSISPKFLRMEIQHCPFKSPVVYW